MTRYQDLGMTSTNLEILSKIGLSHYLSGLKKLRAIHEDISESIKGKTVAVSGATGWIGRNLLPHLDRAESLRLFSRSDRAFRIDKYEYVTEALPSKGSDVEAELFFDLAFNRQDSFDLARQLLSKNENDVLLQFSEEAISSDKVGRYICFSSGAAQKEKPTVYGDQKAKLEGIFEKFSRPSDRMLRVWAMTGRFASIREKFAVVSFISQAISTNLIQIQASNSVYRSYVNIDELLLLASNPSLASEHKTVNSGGQPIEIFELAQKIQRLLSFEVQISGQRQNKEGAIPEDKYLPPFDESGKILRAAGVETLSLDEQLAVMIMDFASHESSPG